MKILVITAQKPDSTGSGVYVAETVRAFSSAGHEVTLVAGIDISDNVTLPEGVAFHPVRFRTPELPFPVCGMSDQMPYEATRYRDMTPEMCERFKRAFDQVIREACEEKFPDVVLCHHLYLACGVAVRCDRPRPVRRSLGHRYPRRHPARRGARGLLPCDRFRRRRRQGRPRQARSPLRRGKRAAIRQLQCFLEARPLRSHASRRRLPSVRRHAVQLENGRHLRGARHVVLREQARNARTSKRERSLDERPPSSRDLHA